MTLSWRVQNIFVIGRVYFTLECFEFSSNFEFDRNMLSGTGARSGWRVCRHLSRIESVTSAQFSGRAFDGCLSKFEFNESNWNVFSSVLFILWYILPSTPFKKFAITVYAISTYRLNSRKQQHFRMHRRVNWIHHYIKGKPTSCDYVKTRVIILHYIFKHTKNYHTKGDSWQAIGT